MNGSTEYITPYAASIYLGISLVDIRGMLVTGVLPHTISNKTIWIRKEELEKIKESKGV